MTVFRNDCILPTDANAKPIQVLSPVSTEALAISTTAASAAAFTLTTNVIRIVANVACFYRLDGTATTSHTYLPLDTVEYIKVRGDQTLSVITASGTGTMYVSECI